MSRPDGERPDTGNADAGNTEENSNPDAQPPQWGSAFAPPGGGPSPLPVMLLLLVSALLAAVGLVLVARSGAPAVGWVLLGFGVVGAVSGVGLALRNVRRARAIQRRSKPGG